MTKQTTIRTVLLGASIVLFSSAFAGPQDDLWKACMQCDLDGVKKSVADGADVKAMHSSKQNSLALSYFCPNVTAYLLEQGVEPMSDGGGALVGAANNYSIEVVKLLLDAGADPNAVSPIYGASAIDQTIKQTNCVPCLQMLLDKGADLKKTAADGTNYAHTLAAFSMTAEERKNICKQAYPGWEKYGLKAPEWYGDLGTDRNGTPTQMLEILVKGGCDINAQNKDGYTPLIYALRTFRTDISKALVNNGADVTKPCQVTLAGSKITYVPICTAAEFADKELMGLMLENGADINGQTTSNALMQLSKYRGNVSWDGDGFTPLIVSIMSGKTDVAHLLLDKGANINIGSSGTSILATDYDNLFCLVETSNKTPIYWAVEQNDLSLVTKIGEKMLWKFNPDFKIKQFSGGSIADGTKTVKCAKFKGKQSPSLYASQISNKEAATFLASKGL